MSENPYAPLRQWPCDMQRSPQEIERELWTERGIYDERPGLHVVDTRTDCGAAHVCSSIASDSDSDSDADDSALGDGAGVLLWPMAVIAACACWALFAFLTSSPL